MAKANYLPSLDGIRACCIVLVLGSHAYSGPGFPVDWTPVGPYLFNGPLGVLIFFVLSGFLITHLLAREEERTGAISLRNFYARRFLRILPVYFAFLFALASLQALTGLEISWCQYVTALTFTKNYRACASLDRRPFVVALSGGAILLVVADDSRTGPEGISMVCGGCPGRLGSCL